MCTKNEEEIFQLRRLPQREHQCCVEQTDKEITHHGGVPRVETSVSTLDLVSDAINQSFAIHVPEKS